MRTQGRSLRVSHRVAELTVLFPFRFLSHRNCCLRHQPITHQTLKPAKQVYVSVLDLSMAERA